MGDVDTFLEARKRMLIDADNLGAHFTAFSPLNVLPKLWDGRWRLVGLGGQGWGLVDVHRVCMPLPVGQPGDYFKSVIAAVERFGNAHCVPRWVTENFAGPYNVAETDTEYLIPTSVASGMPGHEHKGIRNDIAHAKTLTTGLYQGVTDDMLLTLNDVWYAQAKGHHHRLHDRTDIRSIIGRWLTLKEAIPDIRIAVLTRLDSGRPEAFAIGSALTTVYWHGYTVRYDRMGIRGAAALAHSHLAQSFSQLCENSGGADSSELRKMKRKQSKMSLQVFAIRSKK